MDTKPYGLVSDTHHHLWSAFASVNDNGVNSRLQLLLDETVRCAHEVRKAGGDTIIHAGDLFHVRGSIAPSVLNPTLDCYDSLINDGFKIVINAGNHDLEGKTSARLSSAITALEGIGCVAVNTQEIGSRVVDRVILIPWIANVKDLQEVIISARDACHDPSEVDLILHAPIDGVIPGLPNHGLTPDWLGILGFRSVYSGHYHHHKEFDHHVYSIGALSHHTWSDVGTKAGFLVVGKTGPKWFKSHAPEFVEITADTDPDDIPMIVDGNYCRAVINSSKQKEVEELRQYLIGLGAKGVVILSQKEATVTKRDGATIKAGASLEVSVADFIKGQSYANPEKLAVLCQEILSETRSAT
jgi:DNA repair exonuclease SbcCD nuclease subunit